MFISLDGGIFFVCKTWYEGEDPIHITQGFISSQILLLHSLTFDASIFVSKLKQLSPLQDEAFVLSDPAQSLSELNLLQEGFVFFKRCYSMDQSKQIYLSSGKRFRLLWYQWMFMRTKNSQNAEFSQWTELSWAGRQIKDKTVWPWVGLGLDIFFSGFCVEY